MNEERRRVWTERHRSDAPLGIPSPFVAHALDRLAAEALPTAAVPPAKRALDVACGRGRHALLLAARGYTVDAVDYALPALIALRQIAVGRGLPIRCLAADVTVWPLPSARYALVTVVNFLERSLFEALRAAVAPGGALLLETFLQSDDAPAAHTMNPAFLLAPGELDDVCAGWHVLARHEGLTTRNGKTIALAGVLAQRPLAAATPATAH